jgi:hypothetical protein
VLSLPDLLGSGAYAGASAEAGSIEDRFDGRLLPDTPSSGSLFPGAGQGGNWPIYMILGAP